MIFHTAASRNRDLHQCLFPCPKDNPGAWEWVFNVECTLTVKYKTCHHKLFIYQQPTFLSINFKKISGSHWKVQTWWNICWINIRDTNWSHLISCWLVVTCLMYIWIDCSVVLSWSSDKTELFYRWKHGMIKPLTCSPSWKITQPKCWRVHVFKPGEEGNYIQMSDNYLYKCLAVLNDCKQQKPKHMRPLLKMLLKLKRTHTLLQTMVQDWSFASAIYCCLVNK